MTSDWSAPRRDPHIGVQIPVSPSLSLPRRFRSSSRISLLPALERSISATSVLTDMDSSPSSGPDVPCRWDPSSRSSRSRAPALEFPQQNLELTPVGTAHGREDPPVPAPGRQLPCGLVQSVAEPRRGDPHPLGGLSIAQPSQLDQPHGFEEILPEPLRRAPPSALAETRAGLASSTWTTSRPSCSCMSSRFEVNFRARRAARSTVPLLPLHLRGCGNCCPLVEHPSWDETRMGDVELEIWAPPGGPSALSPINAMPEELQQLVPGMGLPPVELHHTLDRTNAAGRVTHHADLELAELASRIGRAGRPRGASWVEGNPRDGPAHPNLLLAARRISSSASRAVARCSL